MDDTEIAVKLEAHEHEIGSLKHRMDDVEKVTDAIHELTTTTAVLVKSVETTNDNVKELKDTVSELSKEPAKKWEKLKIIIVTAVVSGVVGAIITAVVQAIKLS